MDSSHTKTELSIRGQSACGRLCMSGLFNTDLIL